MFMYVGTYTDPPGGRASGIEVFQFDDETGDLRHVQTAMGVANPSFLALHPSEAQLYAGERYLYAVNEGEVGKVTAYSRDARTGDLTLINHQPSYGIDPCYVSIASDGQYVLVANYTSGSIAALPIEADGSLGEATSWVQHEGGSKVVADRQSGPHAHMIASTPDGKAVLVSDLGTDEVVIYGFAQGLLERVGAIALDAGAGPRHFAFGPDARSLYVLNELNSTLTTFAYNAEKLAFPHRQTQTTLPDGFSGPNATAHVLVSPDGRFVYASNRGHDSIAIFAVDAESGTLSKVAITLTGGAEPRNFALTPDGRWLLAANQNSDTIVPFRRDATTGLLERTSAPISVKTPVCIVFAA